MDIRHNEIKNLYNVPFVGDSLNVSNNEFITSLNGLIYNNDTTYYYMYDTSLPLQIFKYATYLNHILKYQYDYKIWDKNNTLNTDRFNLMIEDIINEVYQ